jgi:hypothetical protein
VLEVMFLFVLRKYPVEISHLVHLKHKYPVWILAWKFL